MAESRFEPGDSVQIDGKGKAMVIEKVYRGLGTFYQIRLCDSDYEFEIESRRLSPYTEPSMTGTQQTTRFATVSESDIDHFIEGQANRNTCQKPFYDL